VRLIRGGLGEPERSPVFVDAEAELPTLARDAERAYVRASLQHQVEAGATRLVPPYHAGGDVADPARQLDLRLARIAARQFNEARLGATGRELYGALRLGVDTLRDPLARAGLVAAYAALDVDGFVVKIDGFDEEPAACAEFFYGLELQSRRPLVAAFPADWQQDAVRQAEARVRRRLTQSG
jgi:hypothetical protein